MAWKIERWLSEVFPGESQIYAEYRELPSRELAIVTAAVLDVALAELITLRLADKEKEAQEFLGLNGDGRAPAGSFGARIQLGVLVGLLTPHDAAALRVIKEIRNLFAHRVRIDFLSPPVLKATTKLHGLWLEHTLALIDAGAISGSTKHITELGRQLPNNSEAGEGLLLSVLTVYQAYFHRMHSRVLRIGDALLSQEEDASSSTS
ncbi:MAG: hypothetical protein Q7T36_15730 [Fluviicoccus sp.]|uniref:hypothetical protein n=1 Tax=Fluviicoccus sp. TaxID=2003552 RepID=UPI002723299A|nr:hypothetical protein [Fluviicoccus sp.]MDO8331915.1 hypothetical protein [Fluviicoccus sp.]